MWRKSSDTCNVSSFTCCRWRWVKRACGAPCVCHWHSPRALRWRLLPQYVHGWVPTYDSALAALQPRATELQSLHLNLLILNYSGDVPSGQCRAMSRAQFMTPFVLQSGRTLLTWWMEWQDRCLHNYPRGIKYSCAGLAAWERREWRLKDKHGTILGAQPLPLWMAGCTQCLNDGVFGEHEGSTPLYCVLKVEGTQRTTE